MSYNHYQRGETPVPGFQLQKFLGRGGFGEVWKAVGPGGVPVAIKVLHDLDRKKGGRELKALRLLKNIRHPNLVPLTGFWLRSRDGELISDEAAFPEPSAQANPVAGEDAVRGTMLPTAPADVALQPEGDFVELVIAMGLCEHSLFDRLRESKSVGHAGVPLDELLTYMEDSARAIDLLNVQHDIQHCDIKPQNILLLSGAAQVADFGLAKMIGDVRESSMGAGTIAYGAPEVLLGSGPTANTDQYSLAISYFELRTGELPFSSDSISEVLNAKQGGNINLDKLPVAERKVLAKATAIQPGDRYPNCLEMVRALRHAAAADRHAPASVKAGYRRPKWHAAAGLLLVAAAAVAANEWFRDSGPSGTPNALLNTASPPVRPGQSPSDQPSPKAAEAVSNVEDNSAAGGNTNNTIASEQRPGLASKFFSRAVVEAKDALRAGGAASLDVLEEIEELGSYSAAGSASMSELSSSSSATGSGDGWTFEPAIPEDAVTDEVVIELPSMENDPSFADAPVSPSAEDGPSAQETTSRSSEVQLDLNIARVRAQWLAAQQDDGIFADPQQPAEFYHNARRAEDDGNLAEARKNYLAMMNLHLEAVDPHLHFQRVLRLQEGRLAARELYEDLQLPVDDRAGQLSVALLSTQAAERISKLESILTEAPNYAPAVYYLSQEYSAEIVGEQSLTDKVVEKNLLDRFEKLVQQGQWLSHFIDQSKAIEMMYEARDRAQQLAKLDTNVLQHPVGSSVSFTNAGWLIQLKIAETTREIFYRVSAEQPYQSTGFNTVVHRRTGRPVPLTQFSLPASTGPTTFWVKYVDVRGIERGPYELSFSPDREKIVEGKRNILVARKNWVQFQPGNQQMEANFSTLTPFRATIREIRYSINSDDLGETLSLPENGGRAPIIPLPLQTHYLAVQITFIDGDTSKIERFENKRVAPPQQQHTQDRSRNSPPHRGGRVLDNVEVQIDPSFRNAPRVRFGF